jgi:predicted SAM-dependent methyltransferase
MRLNLGCGPVRKDGFVNIDINPQVNPDLVLDLNRLPYPFEPDSVDYIYGAQLVEHLHVHCIDFFQECYRILKADGTLEMHLPNMFSLKARLLYLCGRIEGSPCWNPYHFKLVHPRYLLKLLRHLGFEARLHHRGCPTFPFDYLFSDSLWIKARKRR